MLIWRRIPVFFAVTGNDGGSMEEQDRKFLAEMLDEFLYEGLQQAVISSPADKTGIVKVKIRPVVLKGSLMFQAEEIRGTQAFHKNMDKQEMSAYLQRLLDGTMKQAELTAALGTAHVLVSKKGKVTIKVKRQAPAKIGTSPECLSVLSHNRQKQYVLEEGIPVPFLIDLGVMTEEGRIVRSRYDKFRQINRFLEFIEDILPKLNKDRENVILDFGCGKSYLTFAMYYYLKELKRYPVRIIGLDLKKDVITRCNLLSERYGYEGLKFYPGDIASYEGVDQVDMVVTLHACDTATDYALYKVVKWGAKVILSVPCCQHELNRQIKNPLMAPVFQYGLIKERVAALYTDALRAELLESQGYRTQILEFIDMEHTPKNILIRAVRQGEKKDNEREIRDILDFLQADPTLYRLFHEKKA